MKKLLTFTLAVLVLATALVMAAVAAWNRADTLVDRTLLMALGCVTVAAVHLLPALTKRRLMWPLWAGCFLVAIYGHAGFFAFASSKASATREDTSAFTMARKSHREAIEASLATIKARPLALVATQISRTRDIDKLTVLQIELDEAKRVASLRDELVRLDASTASNASTVYATDPVTRQVATLTGASERTVMLILNLFMASLIELVGMVLWLELVKPEFVQSNGSHRESNESNAKSNEQIETSNSQIKDLRQAVGSGECRPTVDSIRKFLGCSQVKAMQLRRELQLDQ